MLVAIKKNLKPGHWHPLRGTIAIEKSMKSQGFHYRNFIVGYPFPVKSKSPRFNFIVFFLNLKNQRWWIQMIKSSAFDSQFLNNEILWFSLQNPTRSCWRMCSNVGNGSVSCGFESGFNPGFWKKLLKSGFHLFMQDLGLFCRIIASFKFGPFLISLFECYIKCKS